MINPTPRTQYAEPDKYAFVQMLNTITKMDGTTPVDILTQYPPQEQMPCVTMNKDGGKGLVESIEVDRLSSEGNATMKVRRDKYERLMGLHIWSLEMEERDFIVAQIIGDGFDVPGAIPLAKMRHYQFCSKYNPENGECSTVESPCEAGDLTDTTVIRPVQWKCPFAHVKTPQIDGTYRNPTSIFEDVGIVLESLIPRGEAKNDQLELVPELFHSVILVDYDIYVETILGTQPFLSYGTADGNEVL